MRIRVDFSMHHESLALLEFALEIGAMKKACVECPGTIAHGDVKHAAPPAGEPNCAAGVGYFDQNRVRLPGDNLGNRRKSNAIFIAERQINQQISHSENSAFFQECSAMRSHSAQVFHRVGECDGHKKVGREIMHRARRRNFTFIPLPMLKNGVPKARGGGGCRWSGGNPLCGRERRLTSEGNPRTSSFQLPYCLWLRLCGRESRTLR